MFQQTKSNINTFFTSYLESRATIKILVIPVGNISNKNFQNYFNRLCQFSCIPLQTITPPAKLVPPTNVNTSSSISSFGNLKKKRNSHNESSSSVFNISYEYGAIYFQFINGKKILDRNEMSTLKTSDLNAHDSPLAIFGLCHCPSTDDIAEAFSKFQNKADYLIAPTIHKKNVSPARKNNNKSNSNNKNTNNNVNTTILKHCFAFDITDLQLEKQETFSNIKDLTVFVADRRNAEEGSILEFQMQVDLGNICNKIIQSLDEKVKSALSGKNLPALRYGLDPNLAKEDAIMRNKQKKKWDMRYAARLRKWCADYCLVAGASIDALQNYTMALSLMKQNGKPIDHLWLGSCYEGCASAIIMSSIQALDMFSDVIAVATGAIDLFNNTRIPFQHDVERNCILAIKHYKECKLENERYLGMILKLCRYYTRLIKPKPVQVMKLINEESLIHLSKVRTSSRIRFYVEVCLLCEIMGLRRKFGYYCHKIATMYADLMNWNTALCFLQLASEAYGCEKNNYAEGMVINGENNKTTLERITNANVKDNNAKDKSTAPSIATDQSAILEDNIDGWPQMKKQYLLELLQLSILTNNHDLGTKYAIETLRALQIENNNVKSYSDPFKLKAKLEVEDLFGVKQQQKEGKVAVGDKHNNTFGLVNNNRNRSLLSFSATNYNQSTFNGNNMSQWKYDDNSNVANISQLSIDTSSIPIYAATDDINTNPSMWILPNGRTKSQLYIMRKLNAITSGLMPKINVDMTNIPEIVMIEPCPISSMRQHEKYIPVDNENGNGNGGIPSLSENIEDLKGATKMAKHGTKIYYDPFAIDKEKDEEKIIEWVKGENCEVLVTLRNNLKVPLYIQDIAVASMDNSNSNSNTVTNHNDKHSILQSFGQTLYCPPLSTQKVKLTVKPLIECERMNINALSITICNLTWCHPFAYSKDIIDAKKRRRSGKKISSFPCVRVLAPLPLMIIRDVRNSPRFELTGANANGKNNVSHATTNSQKSISRLSGTNVTNLALLDGQVHNHGLLVQNVGRVPISYIRINLVLAKRKIQRLRNRNHQQSVSGITNKTDSLQRLNPVIIFSTLENEVPTSYNYLNRDGDSKNANENHVFHFDPAVLENLKMHLPLKPGEKITLPFTIDAQRDIPAAELIIYYGQDQIPDICRSLTTPFKMMTSSSLSIVSIDTVSFHDGILEEYGDFGALSNQFKNTSLIRNNDSNNSDFFLVLLVSNPTKRSFEISGYQHMDRIDDIDLPEIVGRKGSDTSSSIATTPMTNRANSFHTPTASEEKRPKRSSSASSNSSIISVQRRRGSSQRPSSPMFGDSEESEYQKLFVTPLDAGEVQRIVIPISKYAYSKSVPLNGSVKDQVKGNVNYDLDNPMIQNFLKDCIVYVQSKLTLTWKSSNGMVGTLSLHTALSSLTLNACRRMVQIPMKVITCIHYNNKMHLVGQSVGNKVMKEVESNNGKASDSPNISNNNNVSSIYSKYYDGTTDYSSPVKLSNIHEDKSLNDNNQSTPKEKEQALPWNIYVGDRLVLSFTFKFMDIQRNFPGEKLVNKTLKVRLVTLKVTSNTENIYVLKEEDLSEHMHFNGMMEVSIMKEADDKTDCNMEIELLFLKKGMYRFLLECNDGLNAWINEINVGINVLLQDTNV